jgi:pyrroloquinoline quinone biosynthesis protein D
MHKEKSILVNNHFQLQYEEAQGCYVLLYPEGMVQLNQSAGLIMSLCDGENTMANIIKILEDKFGSGDLEKEIEAFLSEAMQRKWIEYAN